MPSHSSPHRHRRLAARTSLSFSATLLGAALVGITPLRAEAQLTVLAQGLADAELWTTDSGSTLLTRNFGRPGAVGRVHLWSAAQLGSRLVVYAAGMLEGGKARYEPGTEWYTDMAGMRYVASEAFVIDAGKMPQPVGNFASRRYSSRNPLIGTPDGYPVEYPLAFQLSGTYRRVDYRAALVSLPVYHEEYVPEPTAAFRPAVGVGFTPTAGVRVGASATWGPYLNDELPPSLLADRSWRSYTQRVGSLDVQLSRGYFELRAEVGGSRYEVPGDAPGRMTVVHGLTYYLEGKYTLTPRLFVASRAERNEYAYIEPIYGFGWIASPTNMYNGEVGAGYRVNAQTLLKASVRADRWDVPPALRDQLPNGAAFALQISRTFDLFERTVSRHRPPSVASPSGGSSRGR
jgi:hypothetical protein